MSHLFNRHHIDTFHKRRSLNFEQHNFLFEYAKDEIETRLSEIKRSFKDKIILGQRIKIDGYTSINIARNNEDTTEIIPLEPQSANCILSILDLHAVNDLPTYLLQIRHALRPDGVFMAALFGGETLFELRHALLNSEIKILGGASPRIYPFADKQQMGALMQNAGFALPVIDSEILPVSYQSMFNLIADLRGMGESNALKNRYKKFTPAKLFGHAAELYQQQFAGKDGRITASFEIIFLIGWAPHESQQQPQKRGSAQISLADHLK